MTEQARIAELERALAEARLWRHHHECAIARIEELELECAAERELRMALEGYQFTSAGGVNGILDA